LNNKVIKKTTKTYLGQIFSIEGNHTIVFQLLANKSSLLFSQKLHVLRREIKKTGGFKKTNGG